MSDVDEPQAEASLATSRSRRDRGRKKASRLQELDNLKASRIHGKRQLGIYFFTAKIDSKSSKGKIILNSILTNFLSICETILPRKCSKSRQIATQYFFLR